MELCINLARKSSPLCPLALLSAVQPLISNSISQSLTSQIGGLTAGTIVAGVLGASGLALIRITVTITTPDPCKSGMQSLKSFNATENLPKNVRFTMYNNFSKG